MTEKQISTILACDLARSIINLAVISMFCTVWFSRMIAVSHLYIWVTLFVLGLSVASGLFYLMHACGLMHVNESNIYKPSLRCLSIVQILTFVCGVLMLLSSFLTANPLF